MIDVNSATIPFVSYKRYTVLDFQDANNDSINALSVIDMTTDYRICIDTNVNKIFEFELNWIYIA